jgi:hypothetical protein
MVHQRGADDGELQGEQHENAGAAVPPESIEAKDGAPPVDAPGFTLTLPPAYPDKGPLQALNADVDGRDVTKIKTIAATENRTLREVLGEAIRLYFAYKEWERGEPYAVAVARLRKGPRVRLDP